MFVRTHSPKSHSQAAHTKTRLQATPDFQHMWPRSPCSACAASTIHYGARPMTGRRDSPRRQRRCHTHAERHTFTPLQGRVGAGRTAISASGATPSKAISSCPSGAAAHGVGASPQSAAARLPVCQITRQEAQQRHRFSATPVFRSYWSRSPMPDLRGRLSQKASGTRLQQ